MHNTIDRDRVLNPNVDNIESRNRYLKVLAKWRQEGKTRSTKFIYENLLLKDRIFPDSPDKLEVANNIDYLSTLLEKYYPGKWDIVFIPDFTYYGVSLKMFYVLYFPEVLVKNDKGEEHKMEDFFLYLKVGPGYFSCGSNRLGFRDVGGLKTTFTLAEYDYGYLHSHLPGVKPEPEIEYFDNNHYQFGKIKSFCKGNGNLFEDYLFFTEDFSDDYLLVEENFVISLGEFVSWESLIGGPYRRISNMNTVGVSEDIYNHTTTPTFLMLAGNEDVLKSNLLAKLSLDSEDISDNLLYFSKNVLEALQERYKDDDMLMYLIDKYLEYQTKIQFLNLGNSIEIIANQDFHNYLKYTIFLYAILFEIAEMTEVSDYKSFVNFTFYIEEDGILYHLSRVPFTEYSREIDPNNYDITKFYSRDGELPYIIFRDKKYSLQIKGMEEMYERIISKAEDETSDQDIIEQCKVSLQTIKDIKEDYEKQINKKISIAYYFKREQSEITHP